VHDFERNLEGVRARIERAAIPEENKKVLFDFERYCAAEGLQLVRRWKLLECLYVVATRHLTIPFKGATAADIWDAVLRIEGSDLAPWSKHDYKVAIRKLFKFVEWGTEALQRRGYPDCVAGIRTRVKKRDQVRIQAADILTEAEALRLIGAATDVQERAFVSGRPRAGRATRRARRRC